MIKVIHIRYQKRHTEYKMTLNFDFQTFLVCVIRARRCHVLSVLNADIIVTYGIVVSRAMLTSKF